MPEFNYDDLADYFMGDFSVADRMHRNREFGFILRTKGIRTRFWGARFVLRRMSDEILQMILKKQFDGDLKRLTSFNWFYREVLERFGGQGIRDIIGHNELVNDDRYSESELLFHLTILTELFTGVLKRKDFFLAYELNKGACHYRRLLGYIAKFPENQIKDVALKHCPFPEATVMFWELLKELYGFTENEAVQCVRSTVLKINNIPFEKIRCWDIVRVTETYPEIRKEYHLLKALFKDISTCPLSIAQSNSDELFRELIIKYRLETHVHEQWQKRLGFKNGFSKIGLLISEADFDEKLAS